MYHRTGPLNGMGNDQSDLGFENGYRQVAPQKSPGGRDFFLMNDSDIEKELHWEDVAP